MGKITPNKKHVRNGWKILYGIVAGKHWMSVKMSWGIGLGKRLGTRENVIVWEHHFSIPLDIIYISWSLPQGIQNLFINPKMAWPTFFPQQFFFFLFLKKKLGEFFFSSVNMTNFAKIWENSPNCWCHKTEQKYPWE